MSEILYIKDDKVIASAEAMAFAEFKKLKSKFKAKFDDVLTYLYYVYKYDGPVKNLYLNERRSYVAESILDGRIKYKDVEATDEFVRAKSLYSKLTTTYLKRDFEQTKQDIEELNSHINKIPFVKKVLLKNHQVSFEYEGQLQTAHISIEVEIDNSEEKSKALKLKSTLYDLINELKTKIDKEEMSAEDDSTSLIEQLQQ